MRQDGSVARHVAPSSGTFLSLEIIGGGRRRGCSSLGHQPTDAMANGRQPAVADPDAAGNHGVYFPGRRSQDHVCT
jgi:hypothetical protein